MSDYIESPVLYKISHGDYCEIPNPDDNQEGFDWILCGDTLREIFDVPRGVKQIQFRAYKEPGSRRVPMNFSRLYGQWFKWFDEEEDVWKEGELLDCLTADAIRQLIKKRNNWYVECYYWE